MRLLLSLLIIAVIIFLLIAPFMPTIRAFFNKKGKDLDRQFGGDQDEDDRL